MTTGPIPLVIVLTGPSGVGKDALIGRIVERGFPIVRPATMTTRAPRSGEMEGVHHYFVTREEFLSNLDRGELLEHAEVYGHLYGVPRMAVRRALESGLNVLIRVDVQGAETLHGLLSGALFLALEPDGIDALQHHLQARGSESPEQIERRLAVARSEMERARQVCHPIRNVEGNRDATVDQVLAVIEEERRKGQVQEVVV